MKMAGYKIKDHFKDAALKAPPPNKEREKRHYGLNINLI